MNNFRVLFLKPFFTEFGYKFLQNFIYSSLNLFELKKIQLVSNSQWKLIYEDSSELKKSVILYIFFDFSFFRDLSVGISGFFKFGKTFSFLAGFELLAWLVIGFPARSLAGAFESTRGRHISTIERPLVDSRLFRFRSFPTPSAYERTRQDRGKIRIKPLQTRIKKERPSSHPA